MEYQIFNKETHEYITTYYNYETLNTLDTSRCYYVAAKKQKNVESSKKEEGNYSVSSTPTTEQDVLSITHPVGMSLYSTMWSSSDNTNFTNSNSCSSYSDSSSY